LIFLWLNVVEIVPSRIVAIMVGNNLDRDCSGKSALGTTRLSIQWRFSSSVQAIGST
jgi:hypothetical protein